MIFNYDGKSYDTADGQEQPDGESARKPAETERLEIDRWSDDGALGRSPASILKGLVRRVTGVRRLRNHAPAATNSSTRDASATPEARVQTASDSGNVASPSRSAAERRRAFYRNPWENT